VAGLAEVARLACTSKLDRTAAPAGKDLKKKLLRNFGLLCAAALSRCVYLLLGAAWEGGHVLPFFAMFCLSKLCLCWLFSSVLLIWYSSRGMHA
jgi:hypothetical protein